MVYFCLYETLQTKSKYVILFGKLFWSHGILICSSYSAVVTQLIIVSYIESGSIQWLFAARIFSLYQAVAGLLQLTGVTSHG